MDHNKKIILTLLVFILLVNIVNAQTSSEADKLCAAENSGGATPYSCIKGNLRELKKTNICNDECNVITGGAPSQTVCCNSGFHCCTEKISDQKPNLILVNQNNKFEDINGVKESLQAYATLSVPNNGQITYGTLAQNSLDPSVPSKAIYGEAQGYKEIAGLKRDYEGILLFEEAKKLDGDKVVTGIPKVVLKIGAPTGEFLCTDYHKKNNPDGQTKYVCQNNFKNGQDESFNGCVTGNKCGGQDCCGSMFGVFCCPEGKGDEIVPAPAIVPLTDAANKIAKLYVNNPFTIEVVDALDNAPHMDLKFESNSWRWRKHGSKDDFVPTGIGQDSGSDWANTLLEKINGKTLEDGLNLIVGEANAKTPALNTPVGSSVQLPVYPKLIVSDDDENKVETFERTKSESLDYNTFLNTLIGKKLITLNQAQQLGTRQVDLTDPLESKIIIIDLPGPQDYAVKFKNKDWYWCQEGFLGLGSLFGGTCDPKNLLGMPALKDIPSDEARVFISKLLDSDAVSSPNMKFYKALDPLLKHLIVSQSNAAFSVDGKGISYDLGNSRLTIGEKIYSEITNDMSTTDVDHYNQALQEFYNLAIAMKGTATVTTNQEQNLQTSSSEPNILQIDDKSGEKLQLRHNGNTWEWKLESENNFKALDEGTNKINSEFYSSIVASLEDKQNLDDGINSIVAMANNKAQLDSESVQILDYLGSMPLVTYDITKDMQIDSKKLAADYIQARIPLVPLTSKTSSSKSSNLPPLTPYKKYAEEASVKYDVDPILLKAIIERESGWNPKVVSECGSVGIAQLLRGTAIDMGLKVFDYKESPAELCNGFTVSNCRVGKEEVCKMQLNSGGIYEDERFDAKKSIEAAAKYLKWIENYLRERKITPGIAEIAASYNQGVGNVVKAGGVPLNAEKYASDIENIYKRINAEGTTTSTTQVIEEDEESEVDIGSAAIPIVVNKEVKKPNVFEVEDGDTARDNEQFAYETNVWMWKKNKDTNFKGLGSHLPFYIGISDLGEDIMKGLKDLDLEDGTNVMRSIFNAQKPYKGAVYPVLTVYDGNGNKLIEYTNDPQKEAADTPEIIEIVKPSLEGINLIETYLGQFAHGANRKDNAINLIVLHHTGTNAAKEAIQGLKADGLSSHYLLDKNGDLYQLVDTNTIAWHAKGVNAKSIGIEIVNTGNANDQYTEEQYSVLKQLLLYLADKYNIQLKKDDVNKIGVLGHFEVSYKKRGKWDPSPNFDWTKVGLESRTREYAALCKKDIVSKNSIFLKVGYDCNALPA